MQKLCLRCNICNSGCLSKKKKEKYEPVIILSENLGDKYLLTKHKYTTKSGFEIPSNVYVIEWKSHTYGMLNPNEIPLAIPVLCENNQEIYDMLICIPDYIIKN